MRFAKNGSIQIISIKFDKIHRNYQWSLSNTLNELNKINFTFLYYFTIYYSINPDGCSSVVWSTNNQHIV